MITEKQTRRLATRVMAVVEKDEAAGQELIDQIAQAVRTAEEKVGIVNGTEKEPANAK